MLIEGHVGGVEAEPFSSEQGALDRALVLAARSDGATPADLNQAMRDAGWALYVPYGTEGDCIRVIKRTVDA